MILILFQGVVIADTCIQGNQGGLMTRKLGLLPGLDYRERHSVMEVLSIWITICSNINNNLYDIVFWRSSRSLSRYEHVFC